MKGSVKLPVFIDDARKLVNTTQLRAKYLGASYEAEYCQWQTLHGLGSLMETASLIITPNAYLEGKLLASYPPDPIGDFDVTRATTATRVNSQGLVELVPYNLLQYSEQFDNSSVWGAIDTTITANTTIAPNGTTTADTMVVSSSTSRIYQATSTSKGTYTASIYVKSLSGTPTIQFRMVVDGNDITDSIPTTTDWVRHDYTFTANISVDYFIIRGESGTGSVAIWGSQLVEGSVAKDYQKTETRLNIPRLDYSNGTCPSILVEPQRTNLITWSSSLDNAAYTKAQYGTGTISVTANYGLAPDGTMTADRVQMTQGNFASEIHQRPLTTIGQTYTLSFWAKSLSGTPTLYTAFNNGYENSVTLTTEWVRYEYTYTAANIATGFNLITWTNLSGTSASADILVWGVQHELGSYATSYIPTTSASVTRNADVISKTGISSLIGQTEGTLFVEVDLRSRVNFNYIALNNGGGTSNYISIYFLDNAMGLECVSGSSAQAAIQYNNSSTGIFKIAIAYKQNDFVLYVNGNLIGTDTSGSVPTCDVFDLTAYNRANEMGIKASALWKTRLTNAQLATLTTI